MGKYDLALKQIQEARLEHNKIGEKLNDYDKGYIHGLEDAEAIIYSLQKDITVQSKSLWYRGTPNDIKPNNRGTFILIMKAGFDAEDEGIIKGNIYIDSDFWDGEQWESFETGEGKWTILYFTKLKWVKFPLPEELGIRKSDNLFFN